MYRIVICLQCFDTVGWAAGRASGLQKTEQWGAGIDFCLERDADLHMAQLMPLPLSVSCFSKIQIGFTFLVPAHLAQVTWVVPEKGPLNGCVCVCVCVYRIVISRRARVEFDRVVTESREEARRAAELIPDIEDNILDAETSTQAAVRALRDADQLASAAEQLAIAAQNTSNSALVVRVYTVSRKTRHQTRAHNFTKY